MANTNIKIIIGHRGCGKTSVSSRLAQLYPQLMVTDLDSYIEQKEAMSIHQIFSQFGEAHFRTLESKYFFEILKKLEALEDSKSVHLIVLGAGYNGLLPEGYQVLWWQRISDKSGRVFVDRPRLDKSKKPISEYLDLFPIREKKYSKTSSDVLLLEEGIERSVVGLAAYLGLSSSKLGASTTLLPEDIKTKLHLENKWLKWKNFGFRYIELRTDLLSEEQIRWAYEVIPKHQLLLSIRSQDISAIDGAINMDWPLERQEAVPDHATILSLHDKYWKGSLEQSLQALSKINGKMIKFAPIIESFDELLICHEWLLRDIKNRSFLPCSSDGRWSWYRQWIGEKQSINFIKFGRTGSALDQPSFVEWQNSSVDRKYFLAVLGDPIDHSLSPELHLKFSKNLPFYKIKTEEFELKSCLDMLAKLGGRGFALTSPLKQEGAKIMGAPFAINTLYYDCGKWEYTSTDADGFKALVSNVVEADRVCIWGGGGVLDSIFDILPNASAYSARTGEVKRGLDCDNPNVVVWAVGSNYSDKIKMPPLTWRPQTVIDLSYNLNSPGLEYSLFSGAKYISGYEMLRVQGLSQQKFWSDNGIK